MTVKSETQQEVCRRYVAGESMGSLSEEFKISVGSVRYLLKEWDIPRRPSGPPVDPERIKRIIELRDGMRRTWTYIVKEVGGSLAGVVHTYNAAKARDALPDKIPCPLCGKGTIKNPRKPHAAD